MPRPHKSEKRSWLWAALYGTALTAYAVFTLMDAFVIPRDLVDPNGGNVSSSQAEVIQPESSDNVVTEPIQEVIVTENSYESDTVSITISTLRTLDTDVYIADVVLSDAGFLRAGLAGGVFGRNVSETTSAIAEENGAILAINGDYYGFRDSGYVLRNGYLYRDTPRGAGNEDLVIYGDGTMEIVDESQVSADTLVQAGAEQIFSFGPGLIVGGEISVDSSSEVEQSMNSNPRTAVGMIDPLHYVFLVSDGRTEESAGLTLLELAQVMAELGCETAYNLDGGGSSTMWFMGRVVNHPTDGWRDGERSLSDIVYIKET